MQLTHICFMRNFRSSHLLRNSLLSSFLLNTQSIHPYPFGSSHHLFLPSRSRHESLGSPGHSAGGTSNVGTSQTLHTDILPIPRSHPTDRRLDRRNRPTCHLCHVHPSNAIIRLLPRLRKRMCKHWLPHGTKPPRTIRGPPHPLPHPFFASKSSGTHL